MATINEQLRAARKFRQMTGRELALRSGVSSAYISQLEHGRYCPSADTIQRLAEALDMRILIVPRSL